MFINAESVQKLARRISDNFDPTRSVFNLKFCMYNKKVFIIESILGTIK